MGIGSQFLKETVNNSDYTELSSIYELVDNSKDANASVIKIDWDPKEDVFVIEDNGEGLNADEARLAMNISYDKVKLYEKRSDLLSKRFNVGMKYAAAKIAAGKKQLVIIESWKRGKCITITWDINHFTEYDMVESPINTTDSGTRITIKGTQLNEKTMMTLYREIGTYYYKMIRHHGLTIMCMGKEIKGEDPLYRDSFVDNEYSSFYKRMFHKLTYGGKEYQIGIEAVYLPESMDIPYTEWDNRKTRVLKRSGFYVVYGGRYIEAGNNFNLCGNAIQYYYTGTRVEFSIPKALTSLFKVKYNKSGGLECLTNDTESPLYDLGNLLKNIVLDYWKITQSNIKKKGGPSRMDRINNKLQDIKSEYSIELNKLDADFVPYKIDDLNKKIVLNMDYSGFASIQTANIRVRTMNNMCAAIIAGNEVIQRYVPKDKRELASQNLAKNIKDFYLI